MLTIEINGFWIWFDVDSWSCSSAFFRRRCCICIGEWNVHCILCYSSVVVATGKNSADGDMLLRDPMMLSTFSLGNNAPCLGGGSCITKYVYLIRGIFLFMSTLNIFDLLLLKFSATVSILGGQFFNVETDSQQFNHCIGFPPDIGLLRHRFHIQTHGSYQIALHKLCSTVNTRTLSVICISFSRIGVARSKPLAGPTKGLSVSITEYAMWVEGFPEDATHQEIRGACMRTPYVMQTRKRGASNDHF